MKNFNVGDGVVVTRTPYDSFVPNGTRSTITSIRLYHFGRNDHLYVLGEELSHRLFRYHEIRKALTQDSAHSVKG